MNSFPRHWQWRHKPRPQGDCVVVDIDGVLADAAHRQHYLDPPWRDWDGFFAECGGDGVFEENKTFVKLLNPELVVVLLTSRPTWIQKAPTEWLERTEIRYDLLIMRPLGDFQASPGFKRDELNGLRSLGYVPLLAVDDDMRNVQMYRSEDVPTIFLDSGYHPH